MPQKTHESKNNKSLSQCNGGNIPSNCIKETLWVGVAELNLPHNKGTENKALFHGFNERWHKKKIKKNLPELYEYAKDQYRSFTQCTQLMA